jgi:hypothetical protein
MPQARAAVTAVRAGQAFLSSSLFSLQAIEGFCDVKVADRFVAETVGPVAASRKRKKIA